MDHNPPVSDDNDDPAPPYRVRLWLDRKNCNAPVFDQKTDSLAEALQWFQEQLRIGIEDLPQYVEVTASVCRANGNFIANASIGLPYGVTTL